MGLVTASNWAFNPTFDNWGELYKASWSTFAWVTGQVSVCITKFHEPPQAQESFLPKSPYTGALAAGTGPN